MPDRRGRRVPVRLGHRAGERERLLRRGDPGGGRLGVDAQDLHRLAGAVAERGDGLIEAADQILRLLAVGDGERLNLFLQGADAGGVGGDEGGDVRHPRGERAAGVARRAADADEDPGEAGEGRAPARERFALLSELVEGGAGLLELARELGRRGGQVDPKIANDDGH